MKVSQKKILLVDDSDIVLDLAGAALEAAGYVVVTAQSAIGLSGIVRAEQPACIVLDVTMPGLAGNTSVEIVRRYGASRTPILLHSDRPLQELEKLGLECGADDVVLKSPDCAALLHAVRKHVADS